MTKPKLLTAGSVAALLAFGLAACGGADENTEEKSEDDVAYSELEDAQEAESSGNDEGGERMAGADPYADEENAETSTYASTFNDTDPEADATVNTGGVAATDEAEVITVADVREESDISDMVEAGFARADLDNDGSLDRVEYMILASSLQLGDAGDAVDSARNAIAETAGDAMDSMVGGGDEGVAENENAESPTSVLPGEEIFAEAAGADEALSKEDLRASFLARFQTADANGDQRLDDSEQIDFVRLASSKSE